MFCERCGSKLKENEDFCEKCSKYINDEFRRKDKNERNKKIKNIIIGIFILGLILGNIFIFKNIIWSNNNLSKTVKNDVESHLNEDNKISNNINVNKDNNNNIVNNKNNEENKAYKHKYKFIKGNMNWEEAKEYCQDIGGYLATITTKEEEKEVLSLLENSNVTVLWLGANDLDSLGNFKWISGEEFTYSNWASNEPNNDNGVEHYLVLYKIEGNWLWNDGPLNTNEYYEADNIGFICEWEVDQ